MKLGGLILIGLMFVLGWAGRLDAIIFLDTADASYHASTPGDNSGWQYEGKFGVYLGVPIAPYFFITAKHIGGTVGDVFDFHGDLYATIGSQTSPDADLRIWEVDHAKPFVTYAPLSSGTADLGAVATVMGRGTQRGAEVLVDGVLKGWQWGSADHVERWGRNIVAGSVNGGTGFGELLFCDFDNPGIEGACHLSTGDSSGGLFVMENGLWRLAGINYAVDGPFRIPPAGSGFNAAIFDARGLEYYNNSNWIPVAGASPVPSSFYCTRISGSLTWISGIAPEVASLAPENYAAWQKLYFSPAEISDVTVSGPLADPDHDGINNLLEFALNLDPVFNEHASMVADTGLRGLPLVRIENISGSDQLTIEFVRRTGGSGSGLTYVAEFSSDMSVWQAVGTESVVAINDRWERVKVVDSLTTGDGPNRFARLRLILAE